MIEVAEQDGLISTMWMCPNYQCSDSEVKNRVESLDLKYISFAHLPYPVSRIWSRATPIELALYRLPTYEAGDFFSAIAFPTSWSCKAANTKVRWFHLLSGEKGHFDTNFLSWYLWEICTFPNDQMLWKENAFLILISWAFLFERFVHLPMFKGFISMVMLFINSPPWFVFFSSSVLLTFYCKIETCPAVSWFHSKSNVIGLIYIVICMYW